MRNNYTFSEFVSSAYSLILTKLFYPKARLIRRPVYIRGKKSLNIKGSLTTGHGCRFDLPGSRDTLFIGANCELGDYVHVVAHEHVNIGNNVLIASKVFISDTSHGKYSGENQSNPLTAPNERELATKQVYIGDNVWIGENAVILPGCKIGNGCVVGANAVVAGEVPDNSIVVGIPAKVIKKYNIIKQAWENLKSV